MNRGRFELSRALEADVPALVALLADNGLGAGRESTTNAVPRSVPRHRRRRPSAAPRGAQRGWGHRRNHAAHRCSRALTRWSEAAPDRGRPAFPETRGSGLGSALFDWAHEYGRRRGAILAQLTSDKSRADAHRFYGRLGYEPSHEGFKRLL